MSIVLPKYSTKAICPYFYLLEVNCFNKKMHQPALDGATLLRIGKVGLRFLRACDPNIHAM